MYYALTRLVGDKLVSRDPQRGHVVTPLDVTTSDDVHDARLAIELGAAELVGDRLSAEQLAELRELAAATGSHVRDGRFGDVEGFIDASHAFHRFLVDATGVRSLVDAYEQLSLPDLMAQALPGDTDTDPHLVTDHFDLVEALERADLPAVRRVLTAHNERAKATQRAGIERRGGRSDPGAAVLPRRIAPVSDVAPTGCPPAESVHRRTVGPVARTLPHDQLD